MLLEVVNTVLRRVRHQEGHELFRGLRNANRDIWQLMKDLSGT